MYFEDVHYFRIKLVSLALFELNMAHTCSIVLAPAPTSPNVVICSARQSPETRQAGRSKKSDTKAA